MQRCKALCWLNYELVQWNIHRQDKKMMLVKVGAGKGIMENH